MIQPFHGGVLGQEPPSTWVPHGCRVLDNVVAAPESLFAQLRDEITWTTHMRSRGTASMGVPYNYSGASYPKMPWHPAVATLADHVAKVLGFQPTNCLLNLYPTGQSRVRWHADDTTILADGTGIGIVSLGATRSMGLRCQTPTGFHYEDLVLTSGSLLIMSSEMQQHWRHAIRRCETPHARISLSFRHIVRWPDAPPLVPDRRSSTD